MLALKNGILLDGTKNMVPQEGKIILIDEDRIVDIVENDCPCSDYTVLDLKGQYVLPGLINMHLHLPASGKPKRKESDPKKLVKLMTSTPFLKKIIKKLCTCFAQMQLKSGVTTIRTVGGIQNIDSQIRDDINAEKMIGPRILTANMAISVPDGHMAGSLAYEAVSKEKTAEYVNIIAKDNPDFIKLMITGGVLDAKVKGEPGELKMSPEFVRVACTEAKKKGLYVSAHVESPEGVRVALQNGVHTIEHGATPDEEIIRLFKEKKASLITTLSPALPYALFDRNISHATELSQYNGQIVFQGIIDCAKKCLAEGIPVGLGTDTGCPFVTHYDMWRELFYFHKYCEVSNAFALYSATLGNATIAGIADETGSIEIGKSADLLICKENPLENLTALRTPSMVFMKGKKVEKIAIKKYPNVEKELDKFLN